MAAADCLSQCALLLSVSTADTSISLQSLSWSPCGHYLACASPAASGFFIWEIATRRWCDPCLERTLPEGCRKGTDTVLSLIARSFVRVLWAGDCFAGRQPATSCSSPELTRSTLRYGRRTLGMP